MPKLELEYLFPYSDDYPIIQSEKHASELSFKKWKQIRRLLKEALRIANQPCGLCLYLDDSCSSCLLDYCDDSKSSHFNTALDHMLMTTRSIERMLLHITKRYPQPKRVFPFDRNFEKPIYGNFIHFLMLYYKTSAPIDDWNPKEFLSSLLEEHPQLRDPRHA